MLKTGLGIAALTLFHAALIFVAREVSLAAWGQPRGVSFGITLYYSSSILCFLGFAQVLLCRLLPPRAAVAIAMISIFSTAYLMYPGVLHPAYLAIFAGSAAFFVGLWAVAEWRSRTPANEPG